MKRTRHLEAALELHEVLIIRKPHLLTVPCNDCSPGAGILMTTEAAASITGLPARALFRLLEAGLIHYREADDGTVLVCVDSLATCLGSPTPGTA